MKKLITSSILITSMIAAGCARFSKAKRPTDVALEEESKALTTAVVEMLQSQPPPDRDPYSETALEFARQDQRVEGLPLKPFDTQAVMESFQGSPGGIGFHEQQTETREQIQKRFAFQEKLLAKRAKAEHNLLLKGEALEETQQKRWEFWTKLTGFIGLPFLTMVALCVIFPAAIPIVGRILAWIVTKIPTLAGAIGVVSVKAFDAVVRGIERTRATSNEAPVPPRPPIHLANEQNFAPPTVLNHTRTTNEDSRRGNPFQDLLVNLSREMDAHHKELVRSRKAGLLRSRRMVP